LGNQHYIVDIAGAPYVGKKMSPQHYQGNAQRSYWSKNAFAALVDLPHDGTNSTFDGRDGKVDGIDGKSVGEPLQYALSAAPPATTSQLQTTATQYPLHKLHHEMMRFIIKTFAENDEKNLGLALELNQIWINALCLLGIDQTSKESHCCFDTLKESIRNNRDMIHSRFDALTAKINTLHGENTMLCAAYDSTKAETAALKAAVNALTKKIDEQSVILVPPSPNLMASSTAMEEMTMQLCVVQNDIQDVLEAVRNPPSRRK
jgi:methyl-accepting chemotaxis protein